MPAERRFRRRLGESSNASNCITETIPADRCMREVCRSRVQLNEYVTTYLNKQRSRAGYIPQTVPIPPAAPSQESSPNVETPVQEAQAFVLQQMEAQIVYLQRCIASMESVLRARIIQMQQALLAGNQAEFGVAMKGMVELCGWMKQAQADDKEAQAMMGEMMATTIMGECAGAGAGARAGASAGSGSSKAHAYK